MEVAASADDHPNSRRPSQSINPNDTPYIPPAGPMHHIYFVLGIMTFQTSPKSRWSQQTMPAQMSCVAL